MYKIMRTDCLLVLYVCFLTNKQNSAPLVAGKGSHCSRKVSKEKGGWRKKIKRKIGTRGWFLDLYDDRDVVDNLINIKTIICHTCIHLMLVFIAFEILNPFHLVIVSFSMWPTEGTYSASWVCCDQPNLKRRLSVPTQIALGQKLRKMSYEERCI